MTPSMDFKPPDVPANELREEDLQKQVRAMLTRFGWRIAVTWTSLHSPKGWPDLVGVRDGVMVCIELKRERGKVSPEQQAWLDDLARVPGVKFAGVVRPSMWFAGFLDELLMYPLDETHRWCNGDFHRCADGGGSGLAAQYEDSALRSEQGQR